MNVTILDTGPLVASFYKRDQHHLWAKRTMATLPPPFFTCEAVLTEACFLSIVSKIRGKSPKSLDACIENKRFTDLHHRVYPEFLRRYFSDV